MSEEAKNNKTYITSDIGVAAFLQLRGCRLLVCQRSENGRFHFEFEDLNSECDKLTF